jgi:hypothetical protein
LTRGVAETDTAPCLSDAFGAAIARIAYGYVKIIPIQGDGSADNIVAFPPYVAFMCRAGRNAYAVGGKADCRNLNHLVAAALFN